MGMENIPESNQLLAALDDTVLARLRPDLEPVDIAAREVIAEQAESPSHVYFITSGIVSRVAVTRTGRSLELACTGAEGAAGVFDVLGLPVMSHRIIAQLPTTALRIPAAAFRQHVHETPVLVERVAAYTTVVITQFVQAAICARFHTSTQRLCRWLVTATSRAGVVHLPWSHEWIAEMVGGPRSAVSHAAAALRDAGLIEYKRNGVVVRNVRGLRRQSCECLGIVERTIEQFCAHTSGTLSSARIHPHVSGFDGRTKATE
jgi:CRP-like cAMP-binding protein